MQLFSILALASAASLASAHYKPSPDCSSGSAVATPTFPLGGGYSNKTIARPSSTSSIPSESTVTVPVVVTVTDCPASVTNCPARTHTTYYISTSSKPSQVTATVVPVPVDSSSTTTIIATSTLTTIATITLEKPSATCAASTITLTVSLPPVTVTVQPPASSSPAGGAPPAKSSPAGGSPPANSSPAGGAPPKSSPVVPSSKPYPTGSVTILPVPSGTAPSITIRPSGTGVIPGPKPPTGSPIATGGVGRVGSSALGLFAAVAVAAMLL